ncbi:MAG: hypothetical protein ACOC22_03690 [bacterium]
MSKSKKLFIVEFGKTDEGNFGMLNFLTNTPKPLYVVANSYDEAEAKALLYIENKADEKPRSVIDKDGSLNLNNDDDHSDISVKAIKLASDEIVW